ncbi:porin [Vibrio anguillarum]|uniref:Porin n=14 Tax=Vibrio anguillarum TaxID=55601 RepID=A0AAW4B542_VIBAN|nr:MULTISPECIES: porin [Vibrio]AEH33699.1 Outer membrane porin protein precursor [Vibrio anguillarum 775]AGU58121.1 porin [Vibrio anguillarum M3]AQM19990.1 porin [Vibrio anguillarum]ARV25606.1 gram-negative porin family protein [Vibrio anguillarum]ASF91378.1 porin [Vibrio anguillarum]
MDKMFKRTLLGAAVAMAAVGVQAAQLTDNVQLYGQAAGNLYFESKGDSAKDDTVGVEIESRVGLRGTQSFNNFGPDFVWQIETSNAFNGDTGGQFGGRDTYLGLAFDDVGTVKVGRQLVSIYDYVDWPHSNPGLGNVFDWHNAIGAGYQDRADHVIRFDSVDYSGFKYSLSASKMESSTDNAVVSFALAYNAERFGIHGGAYLGSKEKTVTAAKDGYYEFDSSNGEKKWVDATAAKTDEAQAAYYLVGGNVSITDKLSLTAAWKHMTNEVNNVEKKQDAYSATLAYWATSEWLFKAGYSATTKAKFGGETQAESSSRAITARALYVLDPSAVLYFDVRNYDMMTPADGDGKGNADANDQTRFLMGVEYYF